MKKGRASARPVIRQKTYGCGARLNPRANKARMRSLVSSAAFLKARADAAAPYATLSQHLEIGYLVVAVLHEFGKHILKDTFCAAPRRPWPPGGWRGLSCPARRCRGFDPNLLIHLDKIGDFLYVCRGYLEMCTIGLPLGQGDKSSELR